MIFCHDSVFCDRNDKFNASFFVAVSDSKTNEPPHDKTNKVTCASSKDSDQPGHPSLCWAHRSFCHAMAQFSCKAVFS